MAFGVNASQEGSRGSLPRCCRLIRASRIRSNALRSIQMELFREAAISTAGVCVCVCVLEGLTLMTDGKMVFHNKAMLQSGLILWTDYQSAIFYNMLYQQKKKTLRIRTTNYRKHVCWDVTAHQCCFFPFVLHVRPHLCTFTRVQFSLDLQLLASSLNSSLDCITLWPRQSAAKFS